MFEFLEEIKDVKQVKKTQMIFYAVSKNEIIRKNYRRILRTLELLKKSGKDAKGKLMLTFDGYNDDKREIYMISEIREFVKYIYTKYNFLFYFLTTLDNNRSIVYACINDYKAIQNNNDVFLKIIYNEDIRIKTINSMLEYGKLIDDLEEMQRIIFTFI